MAKVKNETKLIIALLKEKATAKKKLATPDFRNGIDWALDMLDGIIASLEMK